MSNNTPGPWLRENNKHDKESVFIRERDGDGLVAEVKYFREGDLALILAAPELLEAAKTALGFMDAFGRGGLPSTEDLRDAIRAAEGGI